MFLSGVKPRLVERRKSVVQPRDHVGSVAEPKVEAARDV